MEVPARKILCLEEETEGRGFQEKEENSGGAAARSHASLRASLSVAVDPDFIGLILRRNRTRVSG